MDSDSDGVGDNSDVYPNNGEYAYDTDGDGIDDYHWNFDQKDVFLQVIRDNGKIRNNIKIISKDYIPLLESFKDFENDIY